MQTKHLKDQVVGFFWDTVEVRRVRPQRKGRRSEYRLITAGVLCYGPGMGCLVGSIVTCRGGYLSL